MGFSLTSIHTDFWVVLLFSFHLETSTCASKSWAFLVCIKSTLLLDSTIFCLRFQLSGLLPCFHHFPLLELSFSSSHFVFFLMGLCFFSPLIIANSSVPTVCPTIQFSSDTNYLESVQTLWVKGSVPPDCLLLQPVAGPRCLPILLLLLLSCFRRVRLCATPLTAAHQASPSLGFSRQEHWSGLPFPSPVHESEEWKWSRSVVSDS